MRDPLKRQIAKVAALRARVAYRVEKAKLLAELRDARQRGESPSEVLARAEVAALKEELLSGRR